MTTKHTPGPWFVVSRDDGAGHDYHIGSPMARIASIAERQFGEPPYLANYRQANARLIAAAPELLGALKAMVNGQNENGIIPAEFYFKANKAIAKAEGRE